MLINGLVLFSKDAWLCWNLPDKRRTLLGFKGLAIVCNWQRVFHSWR